MALSCGFFNSLNGDRKYDAVQMSSIFDGIILDGIFQAIDDAFAVTVSEDGSGIVVGAGRAWFDHTWTRNDAPYPLTLEQSEVALDRIDAVVLEVDSSSAVRNNTIKIVKGTPSSSPKKPSLTNNETLHQYPLAYLTRPAGVETIAQAQIESVIGTSECPFVTGPLQVITTDSMLAQWQDEFATWFESLEDTLSGDVAANLANQIMQKVDKSSVLDTTEEIEAVTEEGYVAGALVAKELISKIPVVLYNNDDTPAKGAITLSDSAANYTRLTICYKNTNGFYGSVDVYNPNNKTVALLNFAYGDVDNTDPMILKFRVIDISDNKIDTGQSSGGTYVTGEQRLSSGRHYVKGDFISITTVLGYR